LKYPAAGHEQDFDDGEEMKPGRRPKAFVFEGAMGGELGVASRWWS